MSKKKKYSLLLLSIIVIFLPSFLIWFFCPSVSKIENNKEMKVGVINTHSNSLLEIHIMLGDVFTPRSTRNDIGFDLVGISCYFDPVKIENQYILPTNPLLNSALYYSSKDSTEFVYLLSNIIEALNKSREVVSCFLYSDQTSACEGDKIIPYVWTAYPKSDMSRIHGVKYLAALPLFDPKIIFEIYKAAESRRRLSTNVRTSVHRLVNYATDELENTVRSIAFVAIGSTSHRGGDSDYFLNFSQGFLTILQSLESSRPPESLTRIYFVAYNLHTGVFREDAIKGLQAICNYLNMKKLCSSSGSKLIGLVISFLFLLITLTVYKNVEQIIKQKNRMNFLISLLAVASFATALTWGSTVLLFDWLKPKDIRVLLYWHGLMSFIVILFILWLSKRLKFQKK
ncbi:MAG: hypothetical protein ACFFDN_46495 [Candidatus Hodarchaeota archaeon]